MALNKNKTLIGLLLIITLLALVFRLIGINNPYGLWFDEMRSLDIASKAFPSGIINYLKTVNTSPSFYFFNLQFWIKLFGNSDITLRMNSVFWGILTVPAVYFAGKELNSNKTGLLAATFVGINSFLIYYSQEVGFYSFLTLLITLSMLLMLQIIRNAETNKFLLLMFTNILIIFTSAIGIWFVVLEILFFTLYFYLNDKPVLNKFLLSQSILPIILIFDYSSLIFSGIQKYKNIFSGGIPFDWSTLYLYLQNWFSPVIDGQFENIPHYITQLYISHDLFIFLLTTTSILIALTGLTKSLLKKDSSGNILLTIVLFFIIQIIATCMGNFFLISPHTIVILPLLLLVSAYGLLSIENKVISYILIGAFILINLSYLLFSPQSVLRAYRGGGYNIPVLSLDQTNLSSKDIVLCTPSGKFLSRYYPAKYGEIIDFSIYLLQYSPDILGKKLTNEIHTYNYPAIKNYFVNKTIFPPAENYFTNKVFNKLESKKYFIIIKGSGMFTKTNNELFKIANDDEKYKKEDLGSMVNTKFLNDIEKLADNHYRLISTIQRDWWLIKVYQNR